MLCVLPKLQGETQSSGGAGKVDVSSLGAMLNARWKEGSSEDTDKNQVRVGQIRQFKIILMDTEHKRIEVSLAD